jgi:hypothetical protein
MDEHIPQGEFFDADTTKAKIIFAIIQFIYTLITVLPVRRELFSFLQTVVQIGIRNPVLFWPLHPYPG